ncbi:LysR family transcriptional regulator [Pseudonocardia sp. CA-107938]|uniref:LysR family transcriptional regulator n=1 Tax=Pseudonocardia sp. CA-107938 TaxID=3240021 RepID=UPI003D94CAB2
MHTDAVRAFLLVADGARFVVAADRLGVSQQAVSKRIAALERQLGVTLLDRTGGRTALSADGQAFLPHARAVVAAADAAVAALAPSGPLRVDVIGRRSAAADLLVAFHARHPEVEVEMCTLPGLAAAGEALLTGAIDASFCCVVDPAAVPPGLDHARVYDEPLELMVGPRHPLAAVETIRPSELPPLWIPGAVPGTEWATYYDALVAEFGLEIDTAGPNFGSHHLVETVAADPELASLIGARTRIAWPSRAEVSRIPVVDPTPAYPNSLMWRAGDRHPGLAAFRAYLADLPDAHHVRNWLPSWA